MSNKIAIIGRPNVGKSTLFNKLSNTRSALASDESGLTRDRQYITINIDDKHCELIDTGGLSGDKNIIDDNIKNQVDIAINDADIILFMLNTQEGLNPIDSDIANRIRKIDKPIIMVANKSDNLNHPNIYEFNKLGLGEILPISAEHNKNLSLLTEKIYTLLIDNEEPEEQDYGIKIAILGRPNVGKSTLINNILGENRVVVADHAGTTRDSIYIPFVKNDIKYTLIDTAGIRRKRSVKEKIEKFSILKSLSATKFADIVLLILDARSGVGEQDANLLGIINENNKALMIIVNKWDGLDDYTKNEVKRKIDLKLRFVNYASVHFISALNGSGVGKVFGQINEVYQHSSKKFSTSRLNKILELANHSHKAPPVAGKRLKLKYVYQQGINPPNLVFFGNHLDVVPESYKRFLHNIFIRELNLKNTPIKFQFKSGENPFKNKRNSLTERQIKKKRRMMKFVKKGR